MEKAKAGNKKKDEETAKKAKNLLWKILGEQWCSLIFGAPFMFAGSLIEFMAPNYIGRILNEFKNENFDGDGGVYDLLIQWIFVILISGVCSLIRDLIYGLASERIGQSVRLRLFTAIIKKDVNFYDNIRTGDLLSRLGSDTQIVQDGLTTNVSMFVRSLCILLGTVVILFTYDAVVAVIIIGCILPSVVSSRLTAGMLNTFSVSYQKSKGEMSNIATESISNIRTVKAFADEEDSALRFAIASQEVFEYGRSKGYFWALFFLSFRTLQFLADVAIIYIISQLYDYFDLTIGQVTAILLYTRTIMNNAGAITNNIQAVAKVFGSSYEIALLIVAPNKVIFEGTKKPVDLPESGSINLDKVEFSYPSKTDVKVLNGVNIDVQKNQVVALVGHSGCGKSSIISLIERFYDPIDGRLLFSGEDIKELDNKWYH